MIDLRRAVELTLQQAEEAPGAETVVLGSALYERICGCPFDHESPQIRTVRDDVPKELIRITRKSLALIPNDRYQTPGQMASDLRELLQNFDSAPVAVAALRRRRWVGPAIVLAVLIIAVVVIGLARRDADARRAWVTGSSR